MITVNAVEGKRINEVPIGTWFTGKIGDTDGLWLRIADGNLFCPTDKQGILLNPFVNLIQNYRPVCVTIRIQYNYPAEEKVLRDLEVGDCFIYEGEPYIRLFKNILCLNDLELFRFFEGSLHLVDIEITIKENCYDHG